VLETLIGGLLVGVLYSLIALGVVLIFKASGIFNYAQGSMVLFAALSVARLSESMPLWGAVLLSAAIMVTLAYAIELLVLRRLVHQEQIILFMATIGITYFLDGFGQIIWGSDIYQIDLGLPKQPILLLKDVFPGGLLIDPADLIAAVVCALLVMAIALFFQYTRVGRALRAVADDHQAAQSVGIPLNRIWLLVWAVGGLVALAAGVIRGITGFGGAMVMAPPLALLLGPTVAVPVTLLLEGIAAMPMLWQTRRLVRWPLIGPIIAAACVMIPVGGYILVMADALTLRRAIAAAVIVCALLMLSGWRYSGPHRLGTSVAFGALSGTMTGAIAIGAPPVILYLLSGSDPVATTRANLTFYLIGISLAALLMLWTRDVLDLRSAWVGRARRRGHNSASIA